MHNDDIGFVCRCLLSRGFVKLGKWFAQPSSNADKSQNKTHRYNPLPRVALTVRVFTGLGTHHVNHTLGLNRCGSHAEYRCFLYSLELSETM